MKHASMMMFSATAKTEKWQSLYQRRPRRVLLCEQKAFRRYRHSTSFRAVSPNIVPHRPIHFGNFQTQEVARGEGALLAIKVFS